MKKYLIIATAFIFAMSACSKTEFEDNTPDTAITFSVVNRLQQTKATAGLTYPTDVPFGSFAWWTKELWTGAAEDQTLVFMDNQEVKYYDAQKVWSPTSTYYWTKTGYITFASYSPYTQATDATVDGFTNLPAYDVTKGFVFEDYTIVAGTDIDLMYADLAANCGKKTNTDGALVTDGSNPEGGYSGVPTVFHHALCQVGFEFRFIGQKNPNVEDFKLEITDVDIVNIDNVGTFNQLPVAPATLKWASDHTNTASYDYAPASTFELTFIENTAANLAATDNYTPLNKTRILLPQVLENDDDPTDHTVDPIGTTTDQKIVVKYTLKTKYASSPDWVTEEIESAVRLNNGGLSTWLDNRNITYRISINPYSDIPVTFDPAVIDWVDEFSTDVDLNEYDRD